MQNLSIANEHLKSLWTCWSWWAYWSWASERSLLLKIINRLKWILLCVEFFLNFNLKKSFSKCFLKAVDKQLETIVHEHAILGCSWTSKKIHSTNRSLVECIFLIVHEQAFFASPWTKIVGHAPFCSCSWTPVYWLFVSGRSFPVHERNIIR